MATLPVANTVANTAVANTAQQPQQPQQPGQGDVFRNAIMQRFNDLNVPINANTATVKTQTDAYDIQSQRGLQDTRNALAEQAYASGQVNTGGYQDQQQRAVERAAADRANFAGTTVRDAEKARNEQMMQALGLGSQMEMQDKSLSQQESQFSRGLTHDTEKQMRDLAQTDSHFQAQLQNSKDQFAQQMGFKYEELNQQQKQFVDNLAWQKEKAAMDDATARAGISASAGAASAQLAHQQQRALEDDRRWSAYNTQDVIDAANQAAIAKSLGLM